MKLVLIQYTSKHNYAGTNLGTHKSSKPCINHTRSSKYSTADYTGNLHQHMNDMCITILLQLIMWLFIRSFMCII